MRGERKYKIALCRFPGNGSECSGGVTWLMRTFHKMKVDPRIEGVFDVTLADTPITMTRNRAVKQALAAGCDYILMIDSDVVPDYLVGVEKLARPFWDTAWEFMMKRRAEELPFVERCRENGSSQEDIDKRSAELFSPATIAAPYCGPPPFELPYIFRWKSFESDSPTPLFKLEMFEREEAAQRAGIEPVAALPTGLILYDARIFRTLPKPWYAYEFDADHAEKQTTEDVYQTRNADLLGFPQYCLWDSWAIHMKTKQVKKPHYHTADMVAGAMADAIVAKRKANERIMIVNRHDAPVRRD